MKKIISILILSTFVVSAAYADIVKLKNNNRMEGTVVEEYDTFIVLEAYGGNVTIERSEIESIEFKPLSEGFKKAEEETKQVTGWRKKVKDFVQKIKDKIKGKASSGSGSGVKDPKKGDKKEGNFFKRIKDKVESTIDKNDERVGGKTEGSHWKKSDKK